MKYIYILRHAKAEKGNIVISDEERALEPRGVEEATAMGGWLRRHRALFDRVLCSPAERARQTYAALKQAFPGLPDAVYADGLYLASAGEIMAQLQLLDNALQSVLVVGHNPGVKELCTLLAAPDQEATHEITLQFPTAALAIVELAVDNWVSIRPGSARIAQFVTPATVESAAR